MTVEMFSPIDLSDSVLSLYDKGLPPGDSTGWPMLDQNYTVGLGQWTLITGIPSRGKSEFLDALTVNLLGQGWHFCLFSPENQPHELHIAKLLEKFRKQPFRKGIHERMSKEGVIDTMANISHQLRFLRGNSEFNETPNLADILNPCADLIEKAWHRKKVGIVIDPWNELDHARPTNLTETEYISRTLSKLRTFARDWNCHIFLVAHPKMLQKDKDGSTPVPRPYDVSGSAHWYNKADNCITVHRDLFNDPHLVDIHVQKIRFRHMGKPGICTLHYNVIDGTYAETATSWATAGQAF